MPVATQVDIAALQERERVREYERGKREALAEAHTRDQDAHLKRINGSIETFNQLLAQLAARMAALEKAYSESTAVASALADRAVSTKTFVLGVMAVMVPILVLVVTVLAQK